MPKTILVAEDEQPILNLLARVLRGAGYTVLTAGDGGVALNLARREQPDLTILDIMMPVHSGLEVCKTLKDEPGTRHIKVMLLTALDTEEDRRRGLAAGADRYLTKPFGVRDLLGHVRALLPP